jgi:hypothetical protein
VKITVPRPSGTSRRAASPPDQEAAEAADPPELLEGLGREVPKIQAPVVAGVVDHEIRGIEALAGRHHRPIEQPYRIGLTRRVRRDRLGTAARRRDRPSHLLDFLGRAAGDQHVISRSGEASAERGAKPTLGADTDDHGCWQTHGFVLLEG